MLQSFTAHIVKESCGVPEEVPLLILSHLIPIATELRASSLAPAAGFPDLLGVMIGLGNTVLVLNAPDITVGIPSAFAYGNSVVFLERLLRINTKHCILVF